MAEGVDVRRRRRSVAAVLLAGALIAAGAAPASAATEPEPFTVTGPSITGGTSRVHATAAVEGVWTDVLGGVGSDRQTLYYTVHRQRRDSTLHVSVVSPLGTERDLLSAALLDEEGRSCAGATVTGSPSLDTSALMAVSLAIPRSLDASDLACAAAGDFVVQVDHGFHGSVATGRRADVPIELRVREEPPVRDVQSLPATLSTPRWRDPPLGGEARDVTGGRSPNGALVLPAGTYGSTVSTGESQVFAVDLDFGQSLAAAARVVVPSALARRLSAGGSPTLSVQLLGPSRQDAAGGLEFRSDAIDHSRAFRSIGSGSDGDVVYEYTDAVNYRNRFAVSDSAQGAAERGRYLVVVSLLDRDGDGGRVGVPFVLGLGVRGQAAHVPDYLVSDRTTVDGAQSEPGAGLRRVLGAASIGVGVLAVAGAAVLLVVARRRRGSSA